LKVNCMYCADDDAVPSVVAAVPVVDVQVQAEDDANMPSMNPDAVTVGDAPVVSTVTNPSKVHALELIDVPAVGVSVDIVVPVRVVGPILICH